MIVVDVPSLNPAEFLADDVDCGIRPPIDWLNCGDTLGVKLAFGLNSGVISGSCGPIFGFNCGPMLGVKLGPMFGFKRGTTLPSLAGA